MENKNTCSVMAKRTDGSGCLFEFKEGKLENLWLRIKNEFGGFSWKLADPRYTDSLRMVATWNETDDGCELLIRLSSMQGISRLSWHEMPSLHPTSKPSFPGKLSDTAGFNLVLRGEVEELDRLFETFRGAFRPMP